MENKEFEMTSQNKENVRPTPEQMAEWKSKYGKTFLLESEDDVSGEPLVVVMRKPSRASFERFQDEVLKKANKAMRQLVMDNTLFPERKELEALLDEKPGIIIPLAGELQDEMGTLTAFTKTES